MFGIIYGLTCLCAKGIKTVKDSYKNSTKRWNQNGLDVYFDTKGKMRLKSNNHLAIYKINPITKDDCLYDIKTEEYVKVIHKNENKESIYEKYVRETNKIVKETEEWLEGFRKKYNLGDGE